MCKIKISVICIVGKVTDGILPTIVIEMYAEFQLKVKENKGVFFFLAIHAQRSHELYP